MKFQWIGYQWLAQHYALECAQPFRTESAIGKQRLTTVTDGMTRQFFLEALRPANEPAAHLQFALKHEGVHLEFLCRLFHRMNPRDLIGWIEREPGGQYARRACFFYEWLTGQELVGHRLATGNYVNALPADKYFTRATAGVKHTKWRVFDNLPGTREYCPIIERNDGVRAAEAYDCKLRLAELETNFGEDLLLRSAVWLTIKESRASFAIESEQDQVDRYRRFAAVMEKRCGEGDNALNEAFILDLQSDILGEKRLYQGWRQSPVFVGETRVAKEVVHYVAPAATQIEKQLRGLRRFLEVTHGQSPVVRAAVASFGFVYIHPLTDGNGRISRLLLNDVLRRDNAVPSPYILPVSAAIVRNVQTRAEYDRALELFSKPLMKKYQNAVRFGPTLAHPDGVNSNFYFDAYDEAAPCWKYPDLTRQVEYIGKLLKITIEEEMREEARVLLEVRQTRDRFKEVLEAPDLDVDRISRSIRENLGKISGKLRAQYPILEDEKLAADLIRAVMGTS